MGKVQLNRLHTSVSYKQQQHSCNVGINSSVISIDEKYVLLVQCDVIFFAINFVMGNLCAQVSWSHQTKPGITLGVRLILQWCKFHCPT